MTTSVNALPLLHKYVLSPQDDMELTMTKLKFRLCVKEVSEVLKMRAAGMNLCQNLTLEDESPSPSNCKTDDSGLDSDFGILDDSRCLKSFEDIPEEYEVSRQADSVIDETYAQETFASISSSSSSSSSDNDEEEETRTIEKQDIMIQNGEEILEREPRKAQNEVYENFHAVSCLTHDQVSADGIPDFRQGEVEKVEDQEFAPLLNSTEMMESEDQSPVETDLAGSQPEMENQLHPQTKTTAKEEKKPECNDVLEALRILKTRSDLPKITSRKTAIITFSSSNVADLLRDPQKATGDKTELTIKRKSELQVTNERILSKEKKISELYKRIKERDDEDHRLMEEFLKNQKIPVAEPLPPPAATTSNTTTTTSTTIFSTPQNSGTLSKSSLEKVGRDVENPTLKSRDGTLQRKSTMGAGEGPAKKKKRQGSVLQNVVHSLQRRFSKRGRETVA